MESCRVLIDTLKEKETEWTFQGRKVNNDFEVSIEQEKKSFRAGQEDRLQKVSPAVILTDSRSVTVTAEGFNYSVQSLLTVFLNRMKLTRLRSLRIHLFLRKIHHGSAV